MLRRERQSRSWRKTASLITCVVCIASVSSCSNAAEKRPSNPASSSSDRVALDDGQRNSLRCPKGEVLPLPAGDGVIPPDEVVAAQYCFITLKGVTRSPSEILNGSSAAQLANVVNEEPFSDVATCDPQLRPHYFNIVFLYEDGRTEIVNGGVTRDPGFSCGQSFVNNTERANGAAIYSEYMQLTAS